MSLDLTKKQPLNLLKDKVNNFFKDHNIEGLRSQVIVVIDTSGSMETMFRQGIVNGLVNHLLPIGLKLDDDGRIPVYRFDDSVKEWGTMTESDYGDFINKKNLNDFGGTNYAPAINKIVNDTVKGAKKGDTDPVLVLFFTDGENWDTDESTEALIKASHYPIFFQFIGIYTGHSAPRFSYLETLDVLKGREIDNAGLCKLSLDNIPSEENMYEELLGEYAGIKNSADEMSGTFKHKAEAKGMLPWNPQPLAEVEQVVKGFFGRFFGK